MNILYNCSVSPNLLRPNNKIPVLRVTLRYLNLLVKPRFFRFSEKIYNFMIFEKPFKMH